VLALRLRPPATPHDPHNLSDIFYARRPADQTTQIGNRSLAWIREVANGPKPFFAYLGPHAPHYPAEPAPWYRDAFPDIKIPITPNYNVSSPEKTQHVRQNPPLTALAKCWENQHFRDRWQTLLSVDDIVRDLFNLLDELDVAKKTFVIYSSDHVRLFTVYTHPP